MFGVILTRTLFHECLWDKAPRGPVMFGVDSDSVWIFLGKILAHNMNQIYFIGPNLVSCHIYQGVRFPFDMDLFIILSIVGLI